MNPQFEGPSGSKAKEAKPLFARGSRQVGRVPYDRAYFGARLDHAPNLAAEKACNAEFDESSPLVEAVCLSLRDPS